MKILDVAWFSGRDTVGIVRVEDEHDGVRYYIGVGDGHDESGDIQKIADWGSSFPIEVGDILFGVN